MGPMSFFSFLNFLIYGLNPGLHPKPHATAPTTTTTSTTTTMASIIITTTTLPTTTMSGAVPLVHLEKKFKKIGHLKPLNLGSRKKRSIDDEGNNIREKRDSLFEPPSWWDFFQRPSVLPGLILRQAWYSWVVHPFRTEIIDPLKRRFHYWKMKITNYFSRD